VTLFRTTPIRVACAAACALLFAGCGPKVVRNRVFDESSARVELRHMEKGGAPLPRGYAHPATISEVRIAHILANLVFEDSDKKQRPMIRSENVYDLAGGIAVALKQAKPEDEVAAAAFPVDRRLGIFTDARVTAFRLHLEGDAMQIEFIAVEEPLEKDGAKVGFRDYEIPVDPPSFSPRFTIVPGQSQSRLGNRGVSIAWRDEIFRRPVSLRDRDGTGKKRTVLMELPDEPHEKAKPDAEGKREAPPGLSDEQLRALDQADAARSNGSITEAEYQKRRRLILENKLEEAGYGTSP
jgi:hypothetical protein